MTNAHRTEPRTALALATVRHELPMKIKALTIWIIFCMVDLAAFFGGRAKLCEWYHIIPGGGLVRLYQATHGMRDAHLPNMHIVNPVDDKRA